MTTFGKTILGRLSRFHYHISETVGREYKFRYVLNQRALDVIKPRAVYKGLSDGKNYLFGVELRIDPSFEGLIMAEVVEKEVNNG